MRVFNNPIIQLITSSKLTKSMYVNVAEGLTGVSTAFLQYMIKAHHFCKQAIIGITIKKETMNTTALLLS